LLGWYVRFIGPLQNSSRAQIAEGFEGRFIQKPLFTAVFQGSQFAALAIFATIPGFFRRISSRQPGNRRKSALF
jgi:hypothetical protein